MARSNLSIVEEAIKIQGYITVNVARGEMQARSIKVVNGEWVTDILTSDLCGYIRIKKTKAAVVAQAKRIIANAEKIRANSADRERAVSAFLDR